MKKFFSIRCYDPKKSYLGMSASELACAAMPGRRDRAAPPPPARVVRTEVNRLEYWLGGHAARSAFFPNIPDGSSDTGSDYVPHTTLEGCREAVA